MSIVDPKQMPEDNILENSVVDHLNESDADLLNLLTTEDDCSDILNNIATNEQFERLMSSDSNFVDEFIDEMKAETHKIENTYKCFQCGKVFKSKKLLKKHLFIHTGIRKFSCDVCGKAFKYRYEVDVHKKSHNNPTFQCDICSKMFIHKSHLTTHRRKHLNEFVAFCKECNMGFVTKFSHKTHVNLVHKNLQLVCDTCGSRLSSLSALKEHKLTHDPNYGKERSHVCEICGKSYLNSRNLKGHMKLHKQMRSHVCNICGKSVSSKKILETHIKMHTGLKDFICKVCSKGFASKEYLDVHMRIHTGNKPFSCQTCGKRFTQKTSLTVHMRHHTGQRPYKCECGKEFTTKSHLMTHYKAHDVGGVDIDYISRPVQQ
jgi:KRAB domain-containing zinc finger protein